MTSLERQDGNIYGNTIEPAYSIISYTWGRWEVPHRNLALEIHGISWNVPAVDQTHFSASELQKVIYNISLDRQTSGDGSRPILFAWIDVACIDQADETIKSIEIGRQAAIFKNAEYAYVWLNHLDESELQFCDNTLFDSSETLDLISDEDGNEDEPEAIDTDFWVNPFSQALQILLRDPWFTSLWTLQEMYLRADAVILSKTGRTVERREGNGNPLGLANLIINCSNVYTTLTRRILNNPLSQDPAFSFILSMIERLGLYGGPWDNSVLLVGAAQHRQTRETQDRVYGIMQVYGFKLGTSAQPSMSFTLEDLELQLAAAHNMQSPLSA